MDGIVLGVVVGVMITFQVDQKIEITWSDDNQMKTVDENSGSIHDVNEVSHTT